MPSSGVAGSRGLVSAQVPRIATTATKMNRSNSGEPSRVSHFTVRPFMTVPLLHAQDNQPKGSNGQYQSDPEASSHAAQYAEERPGVQSFQLGFGEYCGSYHGEQDRAKLDRWICQQEDYDLNREHGAPIIELRPMIDKRVKVHAEH